MANTSSETVMLQKKPVPKGEGLALLPGSQIPQGFHKHAAEMLLLRPCRNNCMWLMVLPRSCIILVRAVIPAAIPPLQPPALPLLTSCCSHDQHHNVEKQAFPSPNHHGTMPQGQDNCIVLKCCEGTAEKNVIEHPTCTQRRHKGVSPEGKVTGLLNEWHWNRKYLGKDHLNTAGNSTDGSSCRKTSFRAGMSSCVSHPLVSCSTTACSWHKVIIS